MKNVLGFLVVSVALLTGGCGSSSSSGSSLIPQTDYVAAAEAVAPAFTAPSASISTVGKAADTWGYRAYEIAVIFAKDATSLGSNNVFNNVQLAQNVFDDLRGRTDLADYAYTTAFVEPFFGGDAVAYQYVGNYSGSESVTGGSAMKKDADGTVHILSTSARPATVDSGEERSVAKASYSEGAKTLTMDVVQYVDYSGGTYAGSNSGKFIMRMQVEGNSDTYTFDSLKVVKYNPGAGEGGGAGYYINIVGKGVSQGASQYFLFRITDTGGSEAASTDGYFCVASSSLTADTDFTTPQTEGQIESGNCATYLAAVKAMTIFDVDTDLPDQVFDISVPADTKAWVMEFNPIPSP